MLKIPYTNAKVIYRGFKVEKKVLSNMKRISQTSIGFNPENIDMEQLREETFDFLIESIHAGLFSERIVNKLKMNNVKILLKLINLDTQVGKFDAIFTQQCDQTGKLVRVLPLPVRD